MAFTPYATWVAGNVLTAAQLNQQVRDNGNILKTSIADDGKLAASGGLLTNPEVRAPKGTHVAVAIAGGIVTLDFNAGDWFEFTVNGNWSLTSANAPTGNKYASVFLVTVGNGTDYTDGLAAGGTILWPGNVVPVVTTTNNKRDIYVLTYNAATGMWFGAVFGQGF